MSLLMSSAREDLLLEVESFLERNNISPTTFGRLAVNDLGLVRRLRSGADVRTATADRLRNFMTEYEGGKRPLARKSKSVCAAA
jgi:hypothetical protein